MEIQFIGAVRTVTGSMHLIHANGVKFLLDCGLYQGRRAKAREINENFPFDPKEIDFIILSHAHIDHSGNIPQIVKKGFSGKIFSTSATRDLASIMLIDSGHIHEKDAEYLNKKLKKKGEPLIEPLYTASDAVRALEHFVGLPYRKEIEIATGINLIFYDAGHLLGSAITVLNIKENGTKIRLAFTGDLGRPYRPILKNPELIGNVDFLITESTYGGTIHEEIESVEQKIAEIVIKSYDRNGKIIIPAFSVDRTQVLIYILHKLVGANKIPKIPIFIDSPLAVNATEIYRLHPECFDDEMRKFLLNGKDPFNFSMLHYITEVEESKKLNKYEKPCIIISASGMCETGRILHHLANNIENPRNIILIVGYMAENTLGRKLKDGVKKVKIFGDEYTVNAEVISMDALSAHADRNELIGYISHIDRKHVKGIFVVHGEEEQSIKLADALKEIGFENVIIPQRGETFEI
ncbi:metallo-beta-lactamase family protein [Candidatus Kryptonium thompsonii]|uniref:Metallo-beta-lactamase family protein n=2 Tax=Candidatus Kryptonium thompsonii TaxID=1633631 RepID=A0A0P1MB40_9BACT|nr:MBL fold metallo-hydrolase [Candidatus Kryptonium thompsoni]CUS76631.1 metallo-beta-lactamase family protein [Candidatus Kryptonium thompsoni]CUS76816.1 metallo-beta-lactamase family protein [Candidatus Kryptonium thompsoni]CUS84364.1 metallo-beta-lactamase family protein [Candidatus Kryptonium thompsoni]CUS91930.1 metallo-beta-lactamase family protein [Candidatus Kryptonium thompsoni]CUS95253.1 metallo-beta-lactamase family protein [Candidatus Kryptonium thompsoni]